MKHVMIDLETMSLYTRAAILQIGAVEFDPGTRCFGRVFVQNIDLESNRAWGRTVSADTQKWWEEQSKTAWESLQLNKLDLLGALLRFKQWLIDGEEKIVWSNGAAFDIPILEDAFRGCYIDVPWKFYNVMCYRTMKNLHKDIRPEPFKGVKHYALDDAKHQATHLIEILQRVL